MRVLSDAYALAPRAYVVIGPGGAPRGGVAFCEVTAEVRWGAFPASPHDAHRWVADMRRTFETFAWRPRTSLESGLGATIAAMARRAETAGASAGPR